ncbi:hypothetical protein FGO68_gene12591 [Halteria grandinella]|uniref:Uncharacterized protein n=1 Tax=Halteria grandinella TaxID=5974 RepID=A0A8J8T8D5_HALGN|nr:hypothetical protein FGO68_gene12591 [Halteria grandinella]
MELAQHFQQLALLLIQTTKALQVYAHTPTQAPLNQLGIKNDKDFESKLKVMKEILEFGFKIPPNIYQSILQTLMSLLTQKVDLSKDFLVTKLLSVFETLFDAQNGEDLINQNFETITEYIKWSLTLVREQNSKQEDFEESKHPDVVSGSEKFHLTTPEVHLHSLKVLGKIVAKLEPSKMSLILPGVSSMATKVLSGDIKAGERVKVEFCEIWIGNILAKYFMTLKGRERKNGKVIDIKAMMKKGEERKPNQEQKETLERLSDCFKHISEHLYKQVTVWPDFNLTEPQSGFSGVLRLACLNLMKGIKPELRKEVGETRFLFNIVKLYILTGGPFDSLPKHLSTITFTQQISQDFHHRSSHLRKTKLMVNANQRTQTMKHLQALSIMLQHFDVKLQNTEEDIAKLSLSLKSVVHFESQRVLIQEYSNIGMKDSCLDKHQAKKFVNEYIQRSIELFKDDMGFYREYRQVLGSLPKSGEYGQMLYRCLFQEYGELCQVEKETSANLQERCKVLFILSNLNVSDLRIKLQLIDKLVEQIDTIENTVKYPIQERNLALIYYALRKFCKGLSIKRGSEDLELQQTNKLFIYSFCGLSSQLEIVKTISSQIINIFKAQYSTDTIEGLLKANQGFYFTNLFAKVRFLNPTIKNVHLTTSAQTCQANRNLLLVIRSLRSYAPKLLADKKAIYDLLNLCIANTDHSLQQTDQTLILITMDIALILSEHIQDFPEDVQPREVQNQEELPLDQRMREEFIKSGTIAPQYYVPGVLRKLILRLQPYLLPKTKPVSICVKTLEIFANVSSFLVDRELHKDKEHDPFTTADDPDNVHIPCALSLLAYELYPNMLQILSDTLKLESPGKYESQANTFGLQHKIHVINLLARIHPLKCDFLRTMRRFEDDILPNLNWLAQQCLQSEEQSEKRSHGSIYSKTLQALQSLLRTYEATIDKEKDKECAGKIQTLLNSMQKAPPSD